MTKPPYTKDLASGELFTSGSPEELVFTVPATKVWIIRDITFRYGVNNNGGGKVNIYAAGVPYLTWWLAETSEGMVHEQCRIAAPEQLDLTVQLTPLDADLNFVITGYELDAG